MHSVRFKIQHFNWKDTETMLLDNVFYLLRIIYFLQLIQFIIPQVHISQLDFNIYGQYDVILPILNKKYHSDGRFVVNVNKVDVVYL